MDELIPLLRKYVDQNSDVPNLEWDENVSIPLLFDPRNGSNEGRKLTSHYFLLVASITESRLIGMAENSRALMVDLHRFLGDDLFEIQDVSPLQHITGKYAYYRQLGPEKSRIAETLALVNRFVEDVPNGDLIKYGENFSNPSKLVSDLQEHIPRMRGRYSEKPWMYLQWMTRPSELGAFTHFSPGDLYIPLTSYVLNVAESLGIGSYSRRTFWDDPALVDETRTRFTEYVRQIYPDDPAKAAYPFYMLGRWLHGKARSQRVLRDLLRFLIGIHEQTGQPPVRYDVVVRDMSSLERRVREALEDLDMIFHYESSAFPISDEIPTYRPDFILSDYQRHGRTILLEPHGVWTTPTSSRYQIGGRWMEVSVPSQPDRSEREFINKLTLFRRRYGERFHLILLVPPQFYSYVETQYPQAYDELRLIDEVPSILYEIQKYHI